MQAHRLIEVLKEAEHSGRRPMSGLRLPEPIPDFLMKSATDLMEKDDIRGARHNILDVYLHIARDRHALELMQTSIRQADKFELPTPPTDEESLVEISETWKALKEAGLVKLPYPDVYLESVMETSKAIKLRVGLFVSKSGVPESAGPTAFYTTLYLCSLSPSTKGWDAPVITTEKEGDWDLSGRREGHITKEQTGFIIRVMMRWFFFLLTSRQTSRVKYAAPDRLNKARLKSRKEPLDAYTKVLLPNWRETSGKASIRGPIDERKRPRLHYRRGHHRSQRYGEGRKLTKMVYIPHTMVGYEEEGRIYHLQYGQELTDEAGNSGEPIPK